MVSPFRQQERQNRIYSNPIKAHNCLVLWCTLLPIHVTKSPHPLALPSFGYGDQHKMFLLQLLTAVSNKVLWLSRHMQITLWQGDLLTCKQSKCSDPSQFPTVTFLLKPSHCLPISNKEPHNDFARLHMTWPPASCLTFSSSCSLYCNNTGFFADAWTQKSASHLQCFHLLFPVSEKLFYHITAQPTLATTQVIVQASYSQ